jgi:hypothetical protein
MMLSEREKGRTRAVISCEEPAALGAKTEKKS